ncbi:PREDICTED: uncharacterized protein LOC105314737 [Amphimedon queenslandica]|nr:PREDICTED: uncharacterized protein LOC105314737 [Amphimedon queenslandica]|eukprot:XP_019859195.1 PREDICTED: uncharacterized protein LOC105314737 [Amphimedon queenslandica]
MNIVNYLVEVKGCNTQGITTYNRRTRNYLHIHQSSGIALLRVVKCILTGPPGAGKSTLKKRLLNQSLDTGPSLSTGVIDAVVQVDSFRKLSQHNAVVTTEWKEQELDEEAILITKKLLPANNTSDESTRPIAPNETSDECTGTPQPTSVDETVGLTSSFENKQESPKGIDLSPITSQQGYTSVGASSPVFMEAAIDTVVIGESSMEHENVPNSPAKKVDRELEETKSNTEIQKISCSVNDCIRGLSDYVKKIPVRKREEYERKFEEAKDEKHTMLHIIDTGGQPEFHEILPALITGPAINLLVFKLTEDLRSRYEIIYRTSTGDSKPYETSLTHEEVIFHSLASIACLRQNTIGWSFDEIPIKDNSEPVAFLIATHRDQVDENKVSEVNQQLRTKIENSSHFFDSDLIQFSQSEQVIFPLDTTKDEKELDHLRFLLHDAIAKKFQELEIPASWCTLSLKLRKSKKKLFKYDTCFDLAQECGIKDTEEFINVLWYLHHRVGIIMHYPNVAGLEDIIITDLQLVFDRITNLITTCFTFEQSGSAAVEREFRKNGRFSESQLDKISLREKGDPLNAKRLVALLKHLYIVAGPMKDKVGRKSVKYYFMPCALKPADVEREERDGSVSPAPLLICFECGYTPVGVFCCLVVYLLDQKTDQVMSWKLSGNDQYRNRITFQVGQYYDTVTLICRATYLEVWIQQIKGSKLSTSDLLLSLHKGLVTVTQSLHYTYKSKHMFGVPCTVCTAVPHPAVIEFNESATMCVNGRIVEFNEKQLYWSTKVVELNNTTQNTSSKIPPQTVCPRDLFREHSADITQCISLDVIRVADRLFAAKVIPEALRNRISTVLGLDGYEKANRITIHIQNTLSSHSNPIEYLTDVCYALFRLENEILKHFLISILNKLGKPPPQGSIQDISKSSSILNKRPRTAQDDASPGKRFEIDPEGSYDSTFDEGESSGSGILQNESRGHKRQREDNSSPETFTKMKKSTT